MAFDMLNERLVAEAILDVYHLERKVIHQKIKERETADADKIRAQDDETILRYGPICKGFNPDAESPGLMGRRFHY
jgi:hypothetical protein